MATYSVSGIVTVNAHYFHESNPQQAIETLYHEVGHTIDGATYKKTASGEYSLSRDEAVSTHFLKQPTQVMLTTKPSPHSLAPTCFKKQDKKKSNSYRC